MKSRVFEIIAAEQARQNSTVELIASENFVSENVMKAVGSCLTNKYSEGYPAQRPSGNRGRFYGGRPSFRRTITSMSSPIAAPPPTWPPI